MEKLIKQLEELNRIIEECNAMVRDIIAETRMIKHLNETDEDDNSADPHGPSESEKANDHMISEQTNDR